MFRSTRGLIMRLHQTRRWFADCCPKKFETLKETCCEVSRTFDDPTRPVHSDFHFFISQSQFSNTKTSYWVQRVKKKGIVVLFEFSFLTLTTNPNNKLIHSPIFLTDKWLRPVEKRWDVRAVRGASRELIVTLTLVRREERHYLDRAKRLSIEARLKHNIIAFFRESVRWRLDF